GPQPAAAAAAGGPAAEPAAAPPDPAIEPGEDMFHLDLGLDEAGLEDDAAAGSTPPPPAGPSEDDTSDDPDRGRRRRRRRHKCGPVPGSTAVRSAALRRYWGLRKQDPAFMEGVRRR